MAVGKNKKLGKGKGRKPVQLLKKKKFYRAYTPPVLGSISEFGYTIVNKPFGAFLPSVALWDRSFKMNLGDLSPEKDGTSFRKVRLRVVHGEGLNCYTTVHGLSLTTERIKHTTRKLFSLIEATLSLVTTDKYKIRLFVRAQTRRKASQVKKTTYAKSSQKHLIRKMMIDSMRAHTAGASYMDIVSKCLQDTISKEIEKKAERIYPLQTVSLYKLKVKTLPPSSNGVNFVPQYWVEGYAPPPVEPEYVGWDEAPAATENATFEEQPEEGGWGED